MHARGFGAARVAVPVIGQGTWRIDGSERAEAVRALRAGIDAGMTHIDTAEMYGEAEAIVGEAMADCREEIFLVSKVVPSNATRRGVVRACEASLRRLRTDRIDLFYQHRVDPAVPIEDVAGTVKELVAAGKVGHFGLSEAGADTIRRAHAVLPIAALQSEYSLFWREPETQILPLLEELGIGFVPFAPLGKGFLTGKVEATTTFAADDFRATVPRFAPDAMKANFALVEFVKTIAAEKSATPAQVALAWLLARHPWIVPIPGTTKLHRLEENIGGTTVELTDADLYRIEKALADIPIQGERYAASHQRFVNR